MSTQITDLRTGLLQTSPLVPKPTLFGTSASSAVNKAVNTPTDASRLGTPAPIVQPKPQQGTALAQLQGLNSASALAVQTNQKQAQQAQVQQAQVTPAPAPAPSPLQQTLQDILGIGTRLDGQGARSLEIQQEEDVFGKKAHAKELENQILSRSQAYEKQIREAMKNEGGGLRSGIAVDVGELQRRSAQELADLSIAYKIANDDYTGAWEIAQAKIDAEFEPLKQRLETLKSYYTLAQNDMTESEKMQAEQKIAEQEKTLEFERNKQMADYKAGIDRENALYTQQLEQSDPLYQAQLAKARERSVTLAPTDVIEQDGRKLLVNTQTGEVIKDFGAGAGDTGEMKTALAKEFVSNVDALKSDPGMSRAVGAYGISRWTPFTPDQSAVNNFTASIEQMSTTLTLNNLIDAKARGATFGALSIPELNMLAQSATKINSWARNADGGKVNSETDLVHHYEVSEKEMKKELDKISNFGKLDYVLKGGSPSDVGVQVMSDGTYWAKNSDGSFTKIR